MHGCDIVIRDATSIVLADCFFCVIGLLDSKVRKAPSTTDDLSRIQKLDTPTGNRVALHAGKFGNPQHVCDFTRRGFQYDGSAGASGFGDIADDDCDGRSPEM